MLLRISSPDRVLHYDLALVQLYCAAVQGQVIDKQVYAPHLRPLNAAVFLPAADIRQRVMVCDDTRSKPEEDQLVWINWFVVWGKCAYPIEHRDQMHQKFVPSILKPV